MQPGPDETVIFDGHPSWRSVLGLYLKGDALALVVGAIVWFAVSPGLAFSVTILLCVATAGVGSLARRGTRYVITSERLYVRQGLFSRTEQETRLDRVQDVTTRQSAFQRLLQIGTVDFDTAGEDDEGFRFTGVEDPREIVAAVHAAQRVSGPRRS